MEASPSFNIIIGENGSGKTSFLEALSVLSHGKSFRTHKYKPLIQQGCSKTTLFSLVDLADGSSITPLGLQRGIRGEFEIRLAGDRIPSASILASKIPFIVINSTSFGLVEGGPKERREFFDWLVFHVKHDFAFHWREISRCYRQRNALLRKERLSYEDVAPWDTIIARSSEILQGMREQIFTEFFDEFEGVRRGLATDGEFLMNTSIGLKSGWREEGNYKEQLRASFDRDRRYGYSTQGPHKADLVFKNNAMPVSETFSRGQLKLFISALFITKARVVKKLSKKAAVFAIDDLPAELDEKNQAIFAAWLMDLKQQVFITSIDDSFFKRSLNDQQCSVKVFHVKHGEITIISSS